MRWLIGICLIWASASSAGPFDGTYQFEGWSCANIGEDGGALAIQDNMFFGVENTCELTNPTPVRDMDAILYDAKCAGEGETYSQRLMIMRTSDGVAIIQDGWVSDVKSCP